MAEEQDNTSENPVPDTTLVTPNKNNEKAISDMMARNDYFTKNTGKIIAQKAQNPYATLQEHSFDPKSVTDINKNYERYYSHPSFKKLGFNPWRDNESLYNENGSNYGDVARAAIAGVKLAGTGFKAPLRSYADLFTGDALLGDEESAKEMRYYNTVGSSNKGGGVGFVSNLVVNSGFTVGFMGEAILEQAALTGITALTGGAGVGAQAVRAAKTAKDFGTYGKIINGLSKASKALNSYPMAKTAFEAFKKTAQFVNPLDNTLSALNASKNLTGMARASKTAAGFFRDISAANFTLSEAKVEGATTEQDMEEELIAQYKRNNDGKAPSLDELVNIKTAAKTAGDKTLAFNIPAIYLTNKITFAPLFKSFTQSGEHILRNGAKFIDKEGELVQASLLDKFKAVLKPKSLLALPITYFKENASEGIQESVQDIVSGAAKKYYTDIYNTSANKGITFAQAENQNHGKGGWDAISENVRSQFSGKGFETFASGFFMGGLLKVAAGPINLARMGVAEYRKTKNEYTARALEAGNALYQDPLKWFAPQTVNYSSTANGMENQTDAENDNNQKRWSDFEDQNTWSHMTTALDTGTYDIVLDKLKSIKTMTPEAIEEAYPGNNGREVLSKIDKIIGRAENLKNNYTKWNELASNPFNPKAFEKGTPDYNKEAIGFVSWEAAKKSAIFQDYSFNRNVERVNSINQDLLQTPEFAKVSANDISILLDPNALRNELGLINNELEVLGDSIIPGDRKTFRQKQNKQKRLADFQTKLENYYTTQHLTNMSEEEKKANPALVEKLTSKEFKKTTEAQLKNSYEKYIAHISAEANILHVTQPNLDKSFKQILDIHDLKQENIQFAQAISLLSNPKGFTDHYKALNETFSQLYSKRDEIIQQSIKDTQTKIELNVGLLQPLFERGFVVDSKNLEALIEKKEIPSQFYDMNAKQVVTAQDPIRYGQFVDIINNYKEATEPEVTPEEKAAEITPEVVVTETTKDNVVPEQPKEELHINIIKKFNDVHNSEQLLELQEELRALMASTTLEERNRLGLNSKNIDDKIAEKEKEFVENITLDNLTIGNIVSMVDPSQGNMKVISKNAKGVKLQKLGDPKFRLTVDVENLQKSIKSKYSETMSKENITATNEERDKVVQNVTKQEKFTDNREMLEEIMAEADKDEKEFEQNFINKLGCR